MKRILVCVRASEFMDMPDCVNFLVIRHDEKIALNPVFVRRLREYLKEQTEPYVIVARSRYAASIIEAVGVVYERLYW
jgi:hypothetical protein